MERTLLRTSITPCYSESKLQRLQKYLSENDSVHGDLRCQNVLINENTDIKVVDFDWQGKLAKLDIH